MATLLTTTVSGDLYVTGLTTLSGSGATVKTKEILIPVDDSERPGVFSMDLDTLAANETKYVPTTTTRNML